MKQFKKMSVFLFAKLFYLLLFLLMCGVLCGHVFANGVIQSLTVFENAIVLFEKNQINIDFTPNGTEVENLKTTFTVTNLHFPFLLAANNVMISIARIKSTENVNNNIEILTRYITNEEWTKKDLTGTKNDWMTQFAIQNDNAKRINDYNNAVEGLLGAAKGNDVYLLFVRYTKTSHVSSDNSELELKFVVGTVKDVNSKKTIVWDENKLIATPDVTAELKKNFAVQQLNENIFFYGKAFITHDKKIVFALQMFVLNKKKLPCCI